MQRKLAQFRRLACLGLPPQTAVIALLQTLHAIIPAAFNRFGFANSQLRITDAYCENADCYRFLAHYFEEIDGRVDYWPSVSASLRRGPGVGYTLPYQTAAYFRSAYFNEIERPLGAYHQLDATIGDARRVYGSVVISRGAGRPFRAGDVALLRRIVPWFAHALSAPARGAEMDWQQAQAPAVLLVDDDVRVQYADAAGERCLWMLDSDDIADTPIFARTGKSGSALKLLVARLLDVEDGRETPTPTLALDNRWGRFELRAERLRAHGGSQSLIRILVECLQPSALVLYRKLEALGLSPRQQDICQLIVEGLNQTDMADRLGIRPATVNEYVQVLYERLGVHSRAALVRRVGQTPI